MSESLMFTAIGHRIAVALLLASPLIITAFWLGTMLRRPVNIREWFALALFWMISLPVLKLCFLTPSPAQRVPPPPIGIGVQQYSPTGIGVGGPPTTRPPGSTASPSPPTASEYPPRPTVELPE